LSSLIESFILVGDRDDSCSATRSLR